MDNQCFRCGAPIDGFQNGGQVTISGFYDRNNFPYRFPYYNNFTLCTACHDKLIGAINRCLYGYKEDTNGARDDS